MIFGQKGWARAVIRRGTGLRWWEDPLLRGARYGRACT